MIHKLLDEPYWLDMNSEINDFFKDREGKGLYRQTGDTSRISSFINDLIANRTSKLEMKYFGNERFFSIPTFPQVEFIRVDQIPNHIDLRDVKRYIFDHAHSFLDGDYLGGTHMYIKGRQHREGVHKYGDGIWLTHRRPLPPEANPFCEDLVLKIKKTNDIGEALTFLEQIVTYKIKNSTPYKEMNL